MIEWMRWYAILNGRGDDGRVMRSGGVCHWYNVCPLKRYLEEGKLDRKWVEEYCKGNYARCVRREMEEEGRYHPDNMLPDGTIDHNLK